MSKSFPLAGWPLIDTIFTVRFLILSIFSFNILVFFSFFTYLFACLYVCSFIRSYDYKLLLFFLIFPFFCIKNWKFTEAWWKWKRKKEGRNWFCFSSLIQWKWMVLCLSLSLSLSFCICKCGKRTLFYRIKDSTI